MKSSNKIQKPNFLQYRFLFLKEILKVLSYLILGIWRILKIDLKLYPNRVVKLFKDTSYDWIKDVDRELYRR